MKLKSVASNLLKNKMVLNILWSNHTGIEAGDSKIEDEMWE